MTVEPIYHRKESKTQTVEDANKQIASQEMWGRATQNYLNSDIPKVKAHKNELPLLGNLEIKSRGLEFTTIVTPDRGLPPRSSIVLWSGEREGVRTEDGYAKIKVEIGFCNQLDDEAGGNG